MERAVSPIVQFYSHAHVDNRGRALREILAWPDTELESVHDYIQWLFPLPEPSGVNPSAPLLDEQTIEAFLGSRALQDQLRESFSRMLRFYGLKLEDRGGTLQVTESPAFAERASKWLQAGNHNHLRITRILRCLRSLGLDAEASAFFRWLSGAYERDQKRSWPAIPETTFRYWRAAMGAVYNRPGEG